MPATSSDRSSLSLGPARPIERLVVPLVPGTGHDRGSDIAVRWARRWRLPVHLVSVADDAADYLRAAHGRLADSVDVEVTSEQLSGTDVVGVLAAALSPTDLVVMSTSGDPDHPSTSHGWTLLQEVRRPVVLVGPSVMSPAGDGAVILGLDGSPLAESAIEVALGFAGALDTRLWLVQVADTGTVEQVERLRDRGEAVSASAYLRDTADRLGDAVVDVGWELVQSDQTVTALVEFAIDRHAALLVTSTHGESGLRSEVLGSTALGIVAEATVPVLAMVPSGGDEIALGIGAT